MKKKSALKIAKRRWFSRRKKEFPTKSAEEILAKIRYDDAIDAIKNVATHQELRAGLYAIADAINKAADAMREMRSVGQSLERLSDLLAQHEPRKK